MLNKFDEVSRRDFVSGLAKVCLGATVLSQSKWLQAAGEKPLEGKAKNVIFLYMLGGMSHIDTFDPKPENKTVQGPYVPVNSSVSGIQLGQYLPLTAKEMNKIALVRSLTSKEGAHERARYQLHTSYPPLSSVAHPSLGSWVAKAAGKRNPDFPAYFNVGDMSFNSGFFENEYDPFRIGDPENALLNIVPPKQISEERMDRRLKLMQGLNTEFVKEFDKWEPVRDYTTFYDRALAMMRAKDLDAFDLTKESDENRERYGKNRFGQGVLLARRLAERKVRFVEVALGNWDTHQENFTRVKDLSTQLDKALSSLLQDLAKTGLLSETIVVVASEFGRTPRINEGDGRDHHPKVFSALLAGGGIAGGQVYGSSDERGEEVRDKPVTMMDLNATIAKAMGLNPSEETVSPVGRPFKLAADGKPISKILS